MSDATPADGGGPKGDTILLLIAQHAALARLLLAKGVYTAAEYNDYVAQMQADVDLSFKRLTEAAPPPAAFTATDNRTASTRRRRKPSS